MAFKYIVANALVDFMIKITSLHNCKLKTPVKLSCKLRLCSFVIKSYTVNIQFSGKLPISYLDA